MSHAFARLAFTPTVKAAQEREGSRQAYAKSFEAGDEATHDRLGDAEAEFIAEQRSFYMATVSETGWPYVQHRGGPVGFLRVLDEKTLAFCDFAGNRQLVSVGYLSANDRVALILVDYLGQRRLKLLGRVRLHDLAEGNELARQLCPPRDGARSKRAVVITVEAFDWNCPQHIPQRFEAVDVRRELDRRDLRIAELEAELALRSPAAVT